MEGTSYLAADAPQGAQVNQASSYAAAPVEGADLTASSDPVIAIVDANHAKALSAVSQHPQFSRKVDKLINKAKNQSSAGTVKNTSASTQTSDMKFAKKLLSKAEKKMDIMKAKQGKAAQANATLVGLGALLAIVGHVLVLATSGTAATIGVVALAVGVILLILSLISN